MLPTRTATSRKRKQKLATKISIFDWANIPQMSRCMVDVPRPPRMQTIPSHPIETDKWRKLVFEGDRLTLLDWQIIFRTSGAMDVGYMLSQSLGVEERRANGQTLIDAYLESLAGHGVVQDQDAFREALRAAIMLCIVYPLNAGAIIDENFERSKQLAEAMMSRSCAAIEDYDCLAIL